MKIKGRVIRIRREPQKYTLYLQNGFVAIAYFADACNPLKSVLQQIEAGDFVDIHGEFNEMDDSISVRRIEILMKPLRKFPVINSLSENNYTHRELALVAHPSIMKTFIYRHTAKERIRTYLNNLGFIEVETPYLCPYPEIAPVNPFVIVNSRSAGKVYLRITNTEYMRRLLVGGFEKMYQIGVCFRDEEPSYKNALEFVQISFGVAFNDYTYLMKLLEDLIYDVVRGIFNTSTVHFAGNAINLCPPFNRLSFREATLKFAGFDIERYSNPQDLRRKLMEMGLTPPHSSFTGYLSMHILLDYLMNERIVPNLIQPTFIYEYPYPLGGPAKEIKKGSWYKQRAELFIGGMEIANISTPQNDPISLRHWYTETLRQKIEGGLEGQVLDENYLYAIECGLPPCTTGAMGFDRLIMLITGKDSIKDVILFPLLPKAIK